MPAPSALSRRPKIHRSESEVTQMCALDRVDGWFSVSPPQGICAGLGTEIVSVKNITFLIAENPFRDFILTVAKPFFLPLSPEFLQGVDQRIGHINSSNFAVLWQVDSASNNTFPNRHESPVEVQISPLKSCQFSSSQT